MRRAPPRALLDGEHLSRPLAAETLRIELFDELGQRELPALLAVVVELAERPRIHPQLGGHLDVRVRKAMPGPSGDPVLLLPIELHRFGRPRSAPGQAVAPSPSLIRRRASDSALRLCLIAPAGADRHPGGRHFMLVR